MACLQFNALPGALTGREVLHMYARLRGGSRPLTSGTQWRSSYTASTSQSMQTGVANSHFLTLLQAQPLLAEAA